MAHLCIEDTGQAQHCKHVVDDGDIVRGAHGRPARTVGKSGRKDEVQYWAHMGTACEVKGGDT